MSFEAEQAVIGSLLIDNESITEIYSDIEPNMFTDALLGRIYYEIRQSYDTGKKVDALTLCNDLSVQNIPDEQVRKAIMDCVDSTITSTNIGEYAGIVSRDYRARMLNNLLNFRNINGGNVDEKIIELAQSLEDMQATTSEGVMTIAEAVDEYANKRFVPDREQGIGTGFKKLDNILQGLDGGDMCIVAARPSVGKTAFTIEIALNIAKQEKRVALFELEMSTEQVYDRMLSHESGINLKRIRRALNFLGDEKEKYDKANESLKSMGSNLIVIDDKNRVSEMQSVLKKRKADIAIIDYAQLITPESHYRGNRYAEVGAISHSIKQMAKKLRIPVILLAQLNRVSMQTKDKEPTMAELREAGDFEQDASQIILLWNKTEDRTQKGVKVDKNRQGEVGKVIMNFDGARMQFTETDGEFIEADEETPFS